MRDDEKKVELEGLLRESRRELFSYCLKFVGGIFVYPAFVATTYTLGYYGFNDFRTAYTWMMIINGGGFITTVRDYGSIMEYYNKNMKELSDEIMDYKERIKLLR